MCLHQVLPIEQCLLSVLFLVFFTFVHHVASLALVSSGGISHLICVFTAPVVATAMIGNLGHGRSTYRQTNWPNVTKGNLL